MQQLRQDEAFASRIAIRANADEPANVIVLERGHDICLLQQLVQANAMVSKHLLHRDHLRPVRHRGLLLHAAPSVGLRLRRLQNAPVDDAEPALADRALERQPFHRDNELAQRRVLHDVPKAAPVVVRASVGVHQVPQRSPHHSPLHRCRQFEVLAQLRIRHLQDLRRAAHAHRLLAHIAAAFAVAARGAEQPTHNSGFHPEASDNRGQFHFAPQHGASDDMRLAPPFWRPRPALSSA
mmetsp:Transcript_61333/g.176492  ORF Transcript_61333/g.176492 Transcript_61333/m.176492 type:complete len:238 (-) Transcript_61333:2201-2914(-)